MNYDEETLTNIYQNLFTFSLNQDFQKKNAEAIKEIKNFVVSLCIGVDKIIDNNRSSLHTSFMQIQEDNLKVFSGLQILTD